MCIKNKDSDQCIGTGQSCRGRGWPGYRVDIASKQVRNFYESKHSYILK